MKGASLLVFLAIAGLIFLCTRRPLEGCIALGVFFIVWVVIMVGEGERQYIASLEEEVEYQEEISSHQKD